MKTIYTKYILFLFLFLQIHTIQAQWQQTNGPEGSEGLFQMAKSSNNKLWAVTGNGIFYSNNLGQSWIKTLANIENPNSVYATGDTIIISYYNVPFTGSLDFSEIHSTDNGNTWSVPINQSNYGFISDELSIYKGKSYYPLSSSNIIYISDDLGATLISKNVPYNNFHFQLNFDALNKSNRKIISGLDQSGLFSIYYSDDDYTTLVGISTLSNKFSTFICLIDSTLLISQYDPNSNSNKLYKTTDFGLNYSVVNLKYSDTIAYNYYNYLDTIYAVQIDTFNIKANDTLFYSTDKGTTWLKKYAPIFTKDLCQTDFVFKINSKQFITKKSYFNSSGISDSSIKLHINNFTNDNTTIINENIKSSIVTDLQSVQDSILFCTTKEGLYKSKDGGNTWFDISPKKNGIDPVNNTFINNDTILLSDQYSKYFKLSIDQGSSWLPISYSNIGKTPKYYLNNILFADSFFSINQGATWQPSIFNNHYIRIDYIIQNKADVFAIDSFGNFGSASSLLKFDFNTLQWNFINIIKINNQISNDTNRFDFNIKKLDSIWYSFNQYFTENTDSIQNYSSFKYSFNGYEWFTCNTKKLQILNQNSLNASFFTLPILCNGLYYCLFNSQNLIYSIDGIKWQSANTFKNKKYNFYNYSAEYESTLASCKNKLYSGNGASGVWGFKYPVSTFSGNVYLDSNNNGIKNAGELPIKNSIISSSFANVSSDSNGYYQILCSTLNDTLKPNNILGFTKNPNYRIVNPTLTTNYDFGYYTPAPFQNLSVDISSQAIRPGFNTKLYVQIKSLGTIANNDTLVLKLDNLLTPINFSIPPNTSTNNIYKWYIPSMQLFDVINLEITALVSAFANIGDTAHCSTNIISALIDIDTTDNYSNLNKIIVGAYDPNEKICLQGSTYDLKYKATQALTYEIHFQNTGTLPTEFVRVFDKLSTKLDVTTFKLLNSSNPVSFSITNNDVLFTFNPLHLTSKTVDEEHSQGFVKFSIMPIKDINQNDVIQNTANIFFDYNGVIVTNTVTTKCNYNFPLKITEFFKNNKPFDVDIYPNPTKEGFYITLNKAMENVDIILTDITGNMVQKDKILIYDKTGYVKLNNLSAGIYLVTIKNCKNEQVIKKVNIQ